MSVTAIFTALLPEHLLLLGIIVIMGLDIMGGRERDATVVALIAVIAATMAAALLYFGGYAAAPFLGQFSVGPQSSLAKAIVIGLAIPVVLLSRDDFTDSRFHLLLLSSLYGVCLMLSADSFLTLVLGLEIMSLPVYVLVLLAFGRPETPRRH